MTGPMAAQKAILAGGCLWGTAIFHFDDGQKRVAEDTVADADASGLWPRKVVTEVSAAGPFWEAEPERQDYLQHYPGGYTCQLIRPKWRFTRNAAAAL